MSECLSVPETMKLSLTREQPCLRTQSFYGHHSHRFAGEQMESEDDVVAPSQCLSTRKSTDRRNLISDSFAKSEMGRGQKQNRAAVSAVRYEYLGSAAPCDFLSPLSRITVSPNWKQRKIQILTLQDICVTLAT